VPSIVPSMVPSNIVSAIIETFAGAYTCSSLLQLLPRHHSTLPSSIYCLRCRLLCLGCAISYTIGDAIVNAIRATSPGTPSPTTSSTSFRCSPCQPPFELTVSLRFLLRRLRLYAPSSSVPSSAPSKGLRANSITLLQSNQPLLQVFHPRLLSGKPSYPLSLYAFGLSIWRTFSNLFHRNQIGLRVHRQLDLHLPTDPDEPPENC
jgi:hypothetical protein